MVRERFTNDNPDALWAVFDDNFWPISFHEKGGKLCAIEIVINTLGAKYLIKLETMDLHMRKVAEDQEPDAEEAVYVIPKDEILPSDIYTLKHTPLEQLEPFLIEQEN